MKTHFTLKYAFGLLLATLLTHGQSSAQLVSTFAGSGAAGSADGTGITASFNWPISLALDKNKNIYVADAESHRIRKISPSGVVTTFAGSVAGNLDGTGTAAQFNHPLGVALDDSGYVYVADSKNNAIRKISPAGVVTTLAGTGVAGSTNGAGSSATFNYPNGLAIDANRNIYVADALNNLIRKIAADGQVSTFAGATMGGKADGQDTLASFTYPTGIALDGSGNLFVADENNHLIRKITAQGMVSTYAGSYLDNIDDTGTAAAFNSPYGVAVDGAGNVYVAEIGNHQIRKISPTRMVTSYAGNGVAGNTDGFRTDASFNSPTGVVLDGAGHLFVGDWKNNTVRKIDLTVTGIFSPRNQQLNIYPNPARISLQIPTKAGAVVAVYNSLGAKVYECVALGELTVIPVKGLAAGYYSVATVAQDGARQYASFTKE